MEKMFLQSSSGQTTSLAPYDYAEVLSRTLEYFSGDELAATTWINKYAMRDDAGRFLELAPRDMHQRMAKAFAEAENRYKRGSSDELSTYGKTRNALTSESIFDLFDQFRYIIPQGSIMAALGNPFMISSLSNCVVLPEIYDSYGGIFYTDQQLAQLFKRRCGAGIDISTLRPAGLRVSNAAGTTTGSVSFMERFSNTTREVSQNGRRGALMITLDIAHPDIEQFITIKQDLKRVTGANISIRVSDEFMQAVESNNNFLLRFPVDSEQPVFSKKVNAKKLWDLIIQCAHNTAEPGIIFWDLQHNYSTSSVYPGFKNVSTNPCSEIAMQGGDSCRLIAINLYSFVQNPFTDSPEFDFEKFYQITYESQRLMDDLVDLELESIDRIIKKVESDPELAHIKDTEIRTWKLLQSEGKKGRRTGLGITALADMLAAMNLKFDSPSALKFTEEVMKTKCRAEFDSSIDMAIERGKFESFDPNIEEQSEFIRMLIQELPEVYARNKKSGRRNISISTVAPTGSLSILAQTSAGIEPVFMTSYKRRRKVSAQLNTKVDYIDDVGDAWEEFIVHHPKLNEWMRITGKTDVKESPYADATAQEINWEKRVQLQAIVQKYVTHSISSTINLPAETPPERIGEIYFQSWKNKLKGITVYRDGSRSGVLVSNEQDGIKLKESFPPQRPQVLECSVLRFMNGYERWIAFVGLMDGRPYEIFTGRTGDSFQIPDSIQTGWIVKVRNGNERSRYDFRYLDINKNENTVEGLSRAFDTEYWNYAKLISGVLRHGMPLVQVISLVRDLHLSNDNINSWKAGVERALMKFVSPGTVLTDRQCPVCGDPEGLIFEEGCVKCVNCGNAQCG
jgi:ribonucleoside-diphosphate reductase alpha chain